MGIVGNQKTIKLLDRMAVAGKIASAYLFIGPESVGKFTAALEFAKKIIGEKDAVNADLVVIAPEIEEKKGIIKKLDIKIETIRELQHKLSLTSVGGRYKAVIIDNAEKLNKAAQNALLKTLEEPQERVVLILVAQNENKILPTIASRCQKIRFGLASKEEIAGIIPSGNKNLQMITFWSLGRPGIALSLVQDHSAVEYRQAVLQEFSSLFKHNLSERFSLAENLSKDTAQLQEKLNLWIIILRESVLGKNKLFKIQPGKALQLIEEIAESIRIIGETNSNARLVMENLFLKF